jgi:hypothetical protein
MPANKKKSRKSPDKNYPGDKKMPGDNTQANDENLHRPYQGYDENKTTNNPAYQSDYDVDENDSNQRLGEYSDWAKTANQDEK